MNGTLGAPGMGGRGVVGAGCGGGPYCAPGIELARNEVDREDRRRVCVEVVREAERTCFRRRGEVTRGTELDRVGDKGDCGGVGK